MAANLIETALHDRTADDRMRKDSEAFALAAFVEAPAS
jgi:hypothetical protein